MRHAVYFVALFVIVLQLSNSASGYFYWPERHKRSVSYEERPDPRCSDVECDDNRECYVDCRSGDCIPKCRRKGRAQRAPRTCDDMRCALEEECHMSIGECQRGNCGNTPMCRRIKSYPVSCDDIACADDEVCYLARDDCEQERCRRVPKCRSRKVPRTCREMSCNFNEVCRQIRGGSPVCRRRSLKSGRARKTY